MSASDAISVGSVTGGVTGPDVISALGSPSWARSTLIVLTSAGRKSASTASVLVPVGSNDRDLGRDLGSAETRAPSPVWLPSGLIDLDGASVDVQESVLRRLLLRATHPHQDRALNGRHRPPSLCSPAVDNIGLSISARCKWHIGARHEEEAIPAHHAHHWLGRLGGHGKFVHDQVITALVTGKCIECFYFGWRCNGFVHILRNTQNEDIKMMMMLMMTMTMIMIMITITNESRSFMLMIVITMLAFSVRWVSLGWRFLCQFTRCCRCRCSCGCSCSPKSTKAKESKTSATSFV